MNPPVADYLLYLGRLFLLTLGTPMACGLLVGIFSHLVSRLLGGRSGRVFDVTSVIGTPVHELGHALMCPIFGHRIRRMLLWTPRPDDGVYGYVEHAYNRKNLWARLGNLFIALGPIFSGLGVTVLALLICFPTQWQGYLDATEAALASPASPMGLLSGIVSLFATIPQAFVTDWLRALIGLLIILPVSLHVTLSWQDIRSGASALPLYLCLLAVFAAITWGLGTADPILQALRLVNLRLLSLFCLVAAFSLLWVLLALLVRLCRAVISWF
jgi:hypothetical protein